jgi:hypothetical protein
MPFSKDTGYWRREALWTVTHLTEAMDSSWTAASSRPQPDHSLLGQVIVWTSDLTTAAWITAPQLPTLTTASTTTKSLFLLQGKGNRKKETKWTIRGTSFPSLRMYRSKMDLGKCNCR